MRRVYAVVFQLTLIAGAVLLVVAALGEVTMIKRAAWIVLACSIALLGLALYLGRTKRP